MPNNSPSEQAALPIGIFDSGVGGLTVLSAMMRDMPRENFLYLGDTARLPYGARSASTIVKYALQATAQLVNRHVKLLVVACNTASAVSVTALREAYPHIPVIGVVEPGAQAACTATRNQYIAVLGTISTIEGKAYPKAIERLCPTAKVQGLACPLFVPLAEEGIFEGSIAEGIVRHYLEPFLRNQQPKPDTLVLGCTHYPMLANTMRKVVGTQCALVDSAATTAKAVQKELADKNLLNTQKVAGDVSYFTTDNPARFAATGSLFLRKTLTSENVQIIDL